MIVRPLSESAGSTLDGLVGHYRCIGMVYERVNDQHTTTAVGGAELTVNNSLTVILTAVLPLAIEHARACSYVSPSVEYCADCTCYSRILAELSALDCLANQQRIDVVSAHMDKGEADEDEPDEDEPPGLVVLEPLATHSDGRGGIVVVPDPGDEGPHPWFDKGENR